MRRPLLLLVALAAVPAAAVAQTDPSASYRTLHTPHFRIHFRDEQRDVARRVAREAERAYGLLAAELTTPRGTIDVTLADEFDISNGFAQVFPSNRMTIFLTPPASGTLLDYDDWLRVVTVHELTHVFHLDRSRGLWRGLQYVFGRAPGLFPNQYQPSWVTEGLATYYESRFTNAGRVGSSPHRQLIAGERRGGLARRRDDATFVNIRWPGGNAAYAYGAELFRQLRSESGDTAVPAYIRATSGQVIPFSTGRHVHRLAGRPIGDVWSDAMNPFRPDSSDGAPETVMAERLLVEPGARVDGGGRYLAYVHDDGSAPRQIRVIDRRTGTVRARRIVTGDVQLAWDGDQLLVTQLDWTGLFQLRSDLYRWAALGDGAWTRVTRDARITTPAAGAGAVTAVQITAGGRRPVRISSSGEVEALPAPFAGSTWQRVEVSPDGRRVAGIVHDAGRWDIVWWPAGEPAAVLRVTDDASVESFVTWTDDTHLLYASDVTGLPQPYRFDTGRGASVALGTAPTGVLGPQALPDGDLLYSTTALGGYRVVTAAASVPPSSRPGPTRPRFEPAGPVPERETGYAEWPSLKPRFWLPYGDLGDGSGDFFGAFTAGIDAIGRTTYATAAAIDPGSGRWIGFFGLSDRRLGRPILDVFAEQQWSSFVGLVNNVPTTVLRRDREVEGGATFAWQRWRWVASGRVGAGWEQDHFSGFLSRNFVTGSASIRVARSVSSSLAISRERGFDVLARYERRQHLGSSGFSNEVRLRLGAFLPLPMARHVLALKTTYGVTGGRFAPGLGVGGASGGGLDPIPGVSVTTRRSFPVRGYPGDVVIGTRAVSATAEYRLPLLYVGRGIKPFPLGLTRVSAAAFVDVGGAWLGGEASRLSQLVGVGGELVADITYGFDIPLRVRMGIGVPARTFTRSVSQNGSTVIVTSVTRGEPRIYVAIGSDF